eukprot:3876354-Amphidinium_carterae.1
MHRTSKTPAKRLWLHTEGYGLRGSSVWGRAWCGGSDSNQNGPHQPWSPRHTDQSEPTARKL